MPGAKAKGHIGSEGSGMTARPRQEYDCDGKCSEHSGVASKQEQRDRDIGVICNRLDTKLKWTTFAWIILVLLSVLAAAASVYSQSIDKDMDNMRQTMKDGLSDIKEGQDLTLKKVDMLVDKVVQMQLDMAKIQSTVDQNRKDLDAFNKQMGFTRPNRN